MKDNVINLNSAMAKNNLNKSSFFSKLFEFLIFVLSAAVIIYYLFRSIFGSPGQFKKDSEALSEMNQTLDSVFVMQDMTYQSINTIKNDQAELREMLMTNNSMIRENTDEISALKKVVNQKINTANQTINTQNKRIIELEQKNYNGLDSFFRSRQPKNR
jgi:hypothetical protein